MITHGDGFGHCPLDATGIILVMMYLMRARQRSGLGEVMAGQRPVDQNNAAGAVMATCTNSPAVPAEVTTVLTAGVCLLAGLTPRCVIHFLTRLTPLASATPATEEAPGSQQA